MNKHTKVKLLEQIRILMLQAPEYSKKSAMNDHDMDWWQRGYLNALSDIRHIITGNLELD